MNLDGRRILVTGAATGIGRATSEHLVARGCRVLGTGLDDAEGETLLSSEPHFRFRRADLTMERDVRATMAEACEFLGGLDGVVNCAGIYETGKRLEDLSDAEWDRTIAVNLTAVFRVCRLALPLLREAGGGSVVNIASVHANATMPGVPAYAASKGGVVALSRQIALDYAADGIRVNALLVGSVATRMTLATLESAGGPEVLGLTFDRRAIARIAQPTEIALVIGFLLSDDSSFITGSAMEVDGGLLARLLSTP